jgi:EAL domain-containing protein (putative c-di-GMP-specific phosphodiesterase class I)
LGRLPLDALKVDRSFVMKMTEDPQSTSIVNAIISLSHALDLYVVAEGVETAEQARLLRLLKCDQAQGYLFARPLPAEEVVKGFGTRFDVT